MLAAVSDANVSISVVVTFGYVPRRIDVASFGRERKDRFSPSDRF
jgi:hypothetical protein